MIRIFAIYRAPHGAPTPYFSQQWEFGIAIRRPVGEPIGAASIELARESFDRTGLERKEPRKVPFEAPNLEETWEPTEESKEAAK